MLTRNMMNQFVVGGLLAVMTMAVQNTSATAQQPAGPSDVPQQAVAVLIPTQGSKVGGAILMQQEGNKVHVWGKVWGLKPGEHGFHIHQYGDLRTPNGTAAGGHYNPDGSPHGGPDSPRHHAGDLGNITANAKGEADVDKTFDFFQVHHVLGRAIVVHGGRDDLKSQPSGAAGPRVAVGVIGIANPSPPPAPPQPAAAQPSR